MNLRQWTKKATAEDWTRGKAWYYEANAFCRSLEGEHTLKQVTGCLAALSPGTEWEHNKRVCAAVVQGITPPYTGYPANMDKAKRILTVADPLEILKGPKVTAFYDNVLRPEESELVTVDTHIARLFLNKFELNKSDENYVFRSGNKVIQEEVRKLARVYNVKPLELQATLWIVSKAHFERGRK